MSDKHNPYDFNHNGKVDMEDMEFYRYMMEDEEPTNNDTYVDSSGGLRYFVIWIAQAAFMGFLIPDGLLNVIFSYTVSFFITAYIFVKLTEENALTIAIGEVLALVLLLSI